MASCVTVGVLVGTGVYANLYNEDEPVLNPAKVSEEVKVTKEPENTQPEQEVVETVQSQPVNPAPQPQPVQVQEPENDNPYAPNSPMGYVFDKRKEIGKPVGKWGMARTWPTVATSLGIAVDGNAQYGDVMVIGDIVYFVESLTEESVNVTTSMSGGVQTTSMSKTDILNRPQIRFIH